jgi:hypothetical protein
MLILGNKHTKKDSQITASELMKLMLKGAQ